MAFFRCDVMSESLGMATSVLVTMPDTGDLAAAPVVYLLHGLTDNCTGWLRYTQAEHLARTHGAILIVPEVQRSFYTDMACGPKYFTYINQELPTLCRRFFGIQPVPERTYIMGLSMGGYGAMKCAFTAPQQYAGCAGFSSVAEIQAELPQLCRWMKIRQFSRTALCRHRMICLIGGEIPRRNVPHAPPVFGLRPAGQSVPRQPTPARYLAGDELAPDLVRSPRRPQLVFLERCAGKSDERTFGKLEMTAS